MWNSRSAMPTSARRTPLSEFERKRIGTVMLWRALLVPLLVYVAVRLAILGPAMPSFWPALFAYAGCLLAGVPVWPLTRTVLALYRDRQGGEKYEFDELVTRVRYHEGTEGSAGYDEFMLGEISVAHPIAQPSGTADGKPMVGDRLHVCRLPVSGMTLSHYVVLKRHQ